MNYYILILKISLFSSPHIRRKRRVASFQVMAATLGGWHPRSQSTSTRVLTATATPHNGRDLLGPEKM